MGVPVLFDQREFSGTSIFWFVFVAIDKNEQTPSLKYYSKSIVTCSLGKDYFDAFNLARRLNSRKFSPQNLGLMTLEDFHSYCLAKPGVEETFPFDEHTLVFKVMGKMFALSGLEREEFSVNLKCDPERSVELREQYPDIQPGWHMNKAHWNTVLFEGDVPEQLLRDLIDHSYDLVVSKLTKKLKAELELLK